MPKVDKQKTLAEKIVNAILEDQNGRSGFDNNWDSIDEEIQNECISEWVDVVQKEIDAELEVA
jgi:hypothetical protein